jgi:hypothetical protein
MQLSEVPKHYFKNSTSVDFKITSYHGQSKLGPLKFLSQIASRWIWDVAWDSWVEAKHETESYVALVLVFALYCE